MLKVTKNEYARTSWNLILSDDLSTLEAYSYRWWRFLWRDKAGNVVFNRTYYSSATSKHQWNVMGILSRLGIRIDIELLNTGSTHPTIESAVQGEIEGLEAIIKRLQTEIDKPRTHKRKNEERLEDIKEHQFRIKDLRRYLTDIKDKQRISRKDQLHADSFFVKCPKPILEELYYFKDVEGESVSFSAIYYWFGKNNGKLDENALSLYLYLSSVTTICEYACAKVLYKLLGIGKDYFRENLLTYQFNNDLANMLPHEDSADYQTLLRFIKRHKLLEKPITTLTLDKLHLFLTGLQNKKNYTSRVVTEFPYSSVLDSIEHEKFYLIKNDAELRREGRVQKHCIGSDNYIKQCMAGYQALNFKGYTFFLNPDLTINQTQGKHNSCTPSEIIDELQTLINKAA